MDRQQSRNHKVRQLALSISIGVLTVVGISAAVGRSLVIIFGEEAAELLLKTMPPVVADDGRLFNTWFAGYPWLTLLHVVPGILFLAAVPVQFHYRTRGRYPNLHRWSGRILIVTALFVGISGLFLSALFPFGGWSATIAAAVAGTVFLFALVKAYLAVRRRDFAGHRRWMIRMFSIGIGIASIRVAGLVIHLATGATFDQMAGWSFWIGFGGTFAVGEWWIRHTSEFAVTAYVRM